MTGQQPFGPEDMARRRKRAIATALILGALVVLFFITTIVRLGGGVPEKAEGEADKAGGVVVRTQ